MDSNSAHQLLTIYTWFGLSAFIFLMALIARFYQRLSSQRTYYQLFIIPVVAFAAATIRFSSQDRITGDILGDSMLLVGGASLAVLCLHMYRLMTSGR